DFTSFFANLAAITESGLIPLNVTPELSQWYENWLKLKPDVEQIAKYNPVYIPRNHLVEEAIQAAVSYDNFESFHTLLSAVTHPYDPDEAFAHLECSAPMDFTLNYQTFCGT